MAVLMNSSGEQPSKPIFIRNRLLGKLSALKDKADVLRKRLSKLPKNCLRYAHLYAEWKRCWKRITSSRVAVYYWFTSRSPCWASLLPGRARQYNGINLTLEGFKYYHLVITRW